MNEIGATRGSLEATVLVPGSSNLDVPQSIDEAHVLGEITSKFITFQHIPIFVLEREAGGSQFAKVVIGGVPTACGLTEPTLGGSRRRNLQHPR
ncbi:hypothetical protein RHMOL_Rhmol03G0167100 [Rhododendron molle]|uniref:Uncharacterized protein n=1 Tax=Rhododendron molle TaxID=49168 RepID=A0ACC0PEX0_RHOML|nr:hypothetical protein RHMOL_Rhmol03G0167100 [Rhododendron molle]